MVSRLLTVKKELEDKENSVEQVDGSMSDAPIALCDIH